MAEVWMGRRGALAGASKAVAIKLLARDVLDDPSYRQMFIEEARLSMLLTHSNVVQVFDVGEADGECYMVMEWVDGLNLSELARKMQGQSEKLSHVVAGHLVGEVLRGLAYAHGLHHDGSKATIVHRDVSPQNVLVSVSGEVKLADFGVARLAREETSGVHVKGKLRYMAPEQLRGRSREPTVDLYAVGAILHELLQGTRFRQGRDEGDIYSMVLSGEYPPLDSDVPPVLVRLHAGLLEPDPARRIQSADEALELLYSWSGYRNSSSELARLVRKWIGVAAPRSGILHSDIVAAVRTNEISRDGGSSAAETLDVPTRQASGRPSSGPAAADAAITAVESGPLADRGATETRTFAETAPETEATSLIASAQPARGSTASIFIGAALAMALSFGVFGLGFPLGWWGGGEAPAAAAVEEPKVVEPKVVEPKGEEPKVEAPKIEEPKLEEPKLEEPEVEEPEVEEPKLEEGTGKSQVAIEPPNETTPPPPPKDLRPATVVFNTGSFNFVYIKIGGTVVALEPNGEMTLKPGSHRLYRRVSDEDEWVRVKKSLVVEPGKSYLVHMTETGFVFK
jgi:serine/threonine protein kinase